MGAARIGAPEPNTAAEPEGVSPVKYQALNEKILSMQGEIVAAIQDVVRIDSVKGPAEPDAPYGRGPKAALDHVLALGQKLGFRIGNVENRVGWIEYGKGEEMVGVLGHLDVVPVGEGWTHPPFGAEIQDGKIYGRGVLDDKGPVIGAVYALKAIRELGLPLDRRIRIMFGTDEECGSSCVKRYIEKGEEIPTVGFTPDADYPLIFCEKGTTNAILGGKIRDRGNIHVLRLEGGTAPNVVTPRCRLTVEGDLPVSPAEGVTVEKKNGCTTVEAVGLGAHGSTPALGINAAVRLFHAVKGIPFGGDFQHMMDFVLKRIGTFSDGSAMGIDCRDEETGETTVNLGVLKYDGEEMSLTLDIRYPKTADPEHIRRQVERCAAEYGLGIIKLWQVPVLYVPRDSELVRKLMAVYTEQTGVRAEPLAIGGGTYAKAFPNMVAFGPLFPGDPEVIHQPDECAEIARLMQSFQIAAAAMMELARRQPA